MELGALIKTGLPTTWPFLCVSMQTVSQDLFSKHATMANWIYGVIMIIFGFSKGQGISRSLWNSWSICTNFCLKGRFFTFICIAWDMDRLKIKAELVLFLTFFSMESEYSDKISKVWIQAWKKPHLYNLLLIWRRNLIFRFQSVEISENPCSHVVILFRATLSRLRRVHAPAVTQAERSSRS